MDLLYIDLTLDTYINIIWATTANLGAKAVFIVQADILKSK